jgi:hypothetical protein
MIEDTETLKEVELLQKEVDEEHTTLGVKKTIGGCKYSQDKSLTKTSNKYGNRIRHTQFNRRQSIADYTAIYIASMKYGLPATSLSNKRIEAIQQYAIDQFLPKMGYVHIERSSFDRRYMFFLC